MENENPKERFLLRYIARVVNDMRIIFRRSEKYWLGQADDYDGQYGGTSSYDRDFKHAYLEKAAACLRAAEILDEMTLSAPFCRSERFITIAKEMAGIPVSLSDRPALWIRTDFLQRQGKGLADISRK